MKENKFLKSLLSCLMAVSVISTTAAPVFAEDIEADPETAVEEAVEEQAEEAAVAEAEATEVEVEEDQSFEAVLDGITVSVEAPAGAFPAGTEMILSGVGADVYEAIEETVTGKVVAAVDITFVKDGEEIQPALPIKVAMNSAEIAAVENPVVVHVDDKAAELETEIVGQVEAASEDVVFEADSFSIYAVIEDGTEEQFARVTVNFINNHLTGEKTVATVYVKNGDDEEHIEKIVYDPGINETLPDGYLFRGWTIDAADANTGEDAGPNYGANYDLETKVYDIQGIKDYLEGLASGNKISEGDELNIYAIIMKTFSITFFDTLVEEDPDTGDEIKTVVTLGSTAVPYALSNTTATTTINMGYAPKGNEFFEGWKVVDGAANILEINGEAVTVDANTVIKNTDTITIKGDVTLETVKHKGAWLVFDENGKGATYCAPQFVKYGEVTQEPRPDEEMTRRGYTFLGWYTAKEGGTKFTFGQTLSERTTIFARWQANDTAPYTVIFWTQNADRSGYDVANSVSRTGNVDDIIPYTFAEYGDEDYVSGFGATDTNYTTGHYQGFCLKESSKGQEIVIRPEGDSVLNLYYDRIVYNFKFYLYRDGTQNNRYDYANNSGSGSSLNELVTWHSNQTEHPSVTGQTIQSETVGNRTYYYFVMSAYYGEDIREKWPTYDQITGANNHEAVSFVMMVGTKLKPSATNQGSGTVKGIISVLNENILGKTNDANGNYVVIRFPDSYYNWRYHIWYETIDGEDYTGKTTHTWNGKTYYEDTVLTVRSSNTTVTNQNAPKYEGFDFVDWRGENWNNQNYWTSGNNPTLYHINQVYNRQTFKISYFDGKYADGNDNENENRSSQLLKESDEIQQGATITEEYTGYVPDVPDGYVFEAWCIDEGCTTPVKWGKMPVGGITVYAKWREIQYRVYLHAETTDTTLSWGSEDQGMNFRINYKGTVSAPTGTRDEYEFDGWYTDNGVWNNFFEASEIPLTESVVTTAYDKTAKENWTDGIDGSEMTKYGTIEGEGYNSDLYSRDSTTGELTERDRFWITHKLDLYAKWKAIIIGAKGINVEYDVNGGSGEPNDTFLYEDNTYAYAQAASTPPASAADEPELKFGYWDVMKWDGTQWVSTGEKALPGDTFTVLKANAKITEIGGSDDAVDPEDVDKNKEYKYTVLLKAVYEPIDEPEPTFLHYYRNWSATDECVIGKGLLLQQEPIQINNTYPIYLTKTVEQESKATETVEVPVIPERNMYKFLGWARKDEYEYDAQGNLVDTNRENPITYYELTEEDLYIKYDEENQKYLAKNASGQWVEAKGIAADEMGHYHALYAVWQTDYFYVDNSSTRITNKYDAQGRLVAKKAAGAEDFVDEETAGASILNTDNETFDITKLVSDGYIYGGYYTVNTNVDPDGKPLLYTADAGQELYWDQDNAFTDSGFTVIPAAGTTYYLKEVPDTYLKPYIQYVYNKYHKNVIQKMIVMSAVDDENYDEFGLFSFDGTIKDYDYLTESFTLVANSGKAVENTPKSLTKHDCGGVLVWNLRGYENVFQPYSTGVDAFKEGPELVEIPYWKTPDGIYVAQVSRALKTECEDKENDTNVGGFTTIDTLVAQKNTCDTVFARDEQCSTAAPVVSTTSGE